MFVAQADIDGKAVSYFEIVLQENVPSVVIAAECIGRITTVASSRNAQCPIGKRIAGARGTSGILCILTIESPTAHVSLTVGSKPGIVAPLTADFHHMPTFDPSYTVCEFPSVAILCFGALIEGGPSQASISRPGKIRE